MRSAGILLYRMRDGRVQVLLAHPGGPFWANKDEGAWSLPKGEVAPGEDLLSVARREFAEEVGRPVECSSPLPLGSVTLRSGKEVHAWACEGEFDPADHSSNSFSMEWPPRSGKMHRFPEVDRVAWFPVEEARRRINAGQVPLIDRLLEMLGE